MERVPFLLDGEVFTKALKAGELRINDLHARLLLASVADELTAKHRDIRVRLLLCLEALSLRMECVARRMDPDKPRSGPDRSEQRLFPLRAHGWGIVSADLSQIPSREEEECVVLSQVAVEDVPILRSNDVEAVYPPKFCQSGFGK